MKLIDKIVCDEARVGPEKSEVKQLICDFSKAKKLFGYQPRYTLEDELMETIGFARNNLILYRPEEYII